MKQMASFRRIPVAPQVQGRARESTFPSPTRGWIAASNLANTPLGSAYVLDNWFPETDGVRLRAGSELFATIGDGDPTLLLARYKTASTEKFFAGNATTIYDITAPADSGVSPEPAYDNLTGGDFSYVQMATSGGEYLILVNGTDLLLLYDGSNLSPVADVAVSLLAFDAQTGVFSLDDTVTGGGSGASATIVGVLERSDNTGILFVTGIAAGPFDNDEALTDTGTGAATSNIPSGVTSTGITITNVTTSDISDVTVYRNRVYLTEKNSLSVWYLPVDAVGGAATELTLQGVFLRGGSVLFADTWSLDAGDGVDDKFVVVTTEGEVAVYEGSYPGGSDWSLVGRYDAAKPLGKNATMKAGGDLLIATVEGMIPLSAILTKDPAALSLSAVSRAIEPKWKREIIDRGTTTAWSVLKWVEKNMLIVGLPTTSDALDATCFIANLESGAWARYIGWNVRSLGIFGGDAYFGTQTGTVLKAESTGADNGSPYVCKMVSHFSDLKSPGTYKTALSGRTIFIASRDFTPQLSVSVNYTVSLPAAPAAATGLGVGGQWDTDNWDEGLWDAGGEQTIRERWYSLGKSGFVIAPQIQVTCGDSLAPAAKLISIDILSEPGAVAV